MMARKNPFLGTLFILYTAAYFLPTCGASAQSDPLPPANTVVSPAVYVSMAPVPRSRTFEVAVVGEILPGFHVNSNPASRDYLIPTQLTAALPAGFRLLSTSYPPGLLRKFKFSPVQLSVYEGKFTLRLRLAAGPDAPLGPHKLPLVLRYQACNDEACLPPVKLPIVAELEVAPAGSKSLPANSAVFRSGSPK